VRVLALGAAILCAAPAAAQYVEPEMQIQKLSSKAYPPVAEDESSIMSSDEFYKRRNSVFSVEEIAVIRFIFKGPWYKSADYLAREKAALLGANGLILVESIGREDMGAGAIRTYKAFRLANSSGNPIYMKPSEEAPPAQQSATSTTNPAATPKPEKAASAAPSEPPRKHRHFEWVWTKDASVLSHRLGFDAARASKDELEQLKLFVRENFRVAEYKKLLRASGKRSKVMLDFLNRAIE
jgi:hypothetical protein